MTKLKLSQLADDVELANVELANESNPSIWTAGDLKNEITQFGDELTGNWFIAERKKWQPCAQSMIRDYIDNQADGMYEDWEERAMDYVSGVLIQNIQTLLDEAFINSSASDYWEWGKPVEIDVFPKS